MFSAFEMGRHRYQRRWAVRRPVVMIDRLFDRLEQLQLQDLHKVPASLRPELVQVETACGLLPGALRTGVRIGTLQDELFDLQAVFLASLRGSYLDDEETGGVGAAAR
jgi:hypothetical protein